MPSIKGISLFYGSLKHAGFCWENLEKTDHLEDLDLNGGYHKIISQIMWSVLTSHP